MATKPATEPGTESATSGFITRTAPHFDSVEEERIHRKQRLAATCRIFGQRVDEAAWRFITMDRACHVQLLAAAAGEPEVWPDELAQALRGTLGSSDFCWLSFQTLWDELMAQGTDFLD